MQTKPEANIRTRNARNALIGLSMEGIDGYARKSKSTLPPEVLQLAKKKEAGEIYLGEIARAKDLSKKYCGINSIISGTHIDPSPKYKWTVDRFEAVPNPHHPGWKLLTTRWTKWSMWPGGVEFKDYYKVVQDIPDDPSKPTPTQPTPTPVAFSSDRQWDYKASVPYFSMVRRTTTKSVEKQTNGKIEENFQSKKVQTSQRYIQGNVITGRDFGSNTETKGEFGGAGYSSTTENYDSGIYKTTGANVPTGPTGTVPKIKTPDKEAAQNEPPDLEKLSEEENLARLDAWLDKLELEQEEQEQARLDELRLQET